MIRASYSVLMRTRNEVGTPRLTTMANRIRKDQMPRAPIVAFQKTADFEVANSARKRVLARSENF